MPLFNKVNGSFVPTKKVYAHAEGTWKNVQMVYSKVNGQWVQIWADTPFTPIASMPTVRSMLVVETVGGYLYALSGQIAGQSESISAPTERYDPVTNTWTTMGSMPPLKWGTFSPATPSKIDSSVFVYNGEIFIHGGLWSTGIVYRPASNTYGFFDPPYQAQRPYVGVIGGWIYLCGGADQYRNYASLSMLQYNKTTSYDETGNYQKYTFSSSNTNMPTIPDGGRSLGGYTVLNNKLYTIGGRTDTSNQNIGDGRVYEYDPSTNKWTYKTELRTPYLRQVVWAYNGWLYVITLNGDLDRYNPITNVWQYAYKSGKAKDMMSTTNGVMIGNKAYTAGGALLVDNSWTNKAVGFILE